MRQANRVVALILAGLIVPAAVAAIAFKSDRGDVNTYRGSRPPVGIELEPFALRSYRGETIRSDQLAGKAIALTFLESKCTSACPVIAFQVARAIDRLTPAERDDVRAIAISTHPGDDTPQSVRQFLQARRALGRIDYLIGGEGELRPVWRRFHVLAALDTGSADSHSASVHVYDRDGVWVSSLHPRIDLSAKNLAHDLRLALDG